MINYAHEKIAAQQMSYFMKKQAPIDFFSAFLAAAADPELKAKAIEGFSERQKKREAEFAKQAASRAPGPNFYNRSYDI